MELVTGRAGSPHITSQQDRQKHQGIWGDEAYILNTGNMLEPEVQSSNKILIKDGALMYQGALFSVKVGTADEVTINNGNQGMKRKDLIVVRYTFDPEQNVESADLAVIQGTPATANPVVPSGTSGDIQAGDETVDCPFMVVNLDGINVTGVDVLVPICKTIPDLSNNSVVDAGQKGNNRYVKYADGRLEQYGTVNISYTDGYGTVTYPVPFAGTVDSYVLITQGGYQSGYEREILSVQKRGLASAFVYSQTPSGGKIPTHNVDWFARGYWK